MICEYSGKALCKNCNGPVYACNPQGHECAGKPNCALSSKIPELANCSHTIYKAKAADPTPLCPRELLKLKKEGNT